MWQAILKIYSSINVFIGFLNISNKGNALNKNKGQSFDLMVQSRKWDESLRLVGNKAAPLQL